MKKVILVLITILISMPLFAEFRGKGERPRGREHNVNRLSESLGLDDTQVAKLQSIFEEAHSSCDGSSREEMRECMHSQKESVDNQIYSILDEDQKLSFDAIQSDRQGGQKGKRSKD